MTQEMWADDLPVCNPCLSGEHDDCPDFLYIPGRDVLACGCDDPEHEVTP